MLSNEKIPLFFLVLHKSLDGTEQKSLLVVMQNGNDDECNSASELMLPLRNPFLIII
jgi:hypothetical protein